MALSPSLATARGYVTFRRVEAALAAVFLLSLALFVALTASRSPSTGSLADPFFSATLLAAFALPCVLFLHAGHDLLTRLRGTRSNSAPPYAPVVYAARAVELLLALVPLAAVAGLLALLTTQPGGDGAGTFAVATVLAVETAGLLLALVVLARTTLVSLSDSRDKQ